MRYVPEIDDLTELLAGAPERRRGRNRAVRNAITLFVLLGCVVWWSTVAPTSDTLMPAVLFAVGFVRYAVQVLVLSTRWGLRRKARATWRRSSVLRQAHEQEIGPEAVTVRTQGQSRTYAWTHFGGFQESDRQFLLVDRAGKPAVVVPKRGLADPELVPACRALITEYLAGVSPTDSATDRAALA
ncbi:YcxB family protein [Actinacidiphila acidipaludis]|uniref:YcxB family protein n=1 Tax=Actinacidiphila acidipaludis TaxID=2873382 RepID=A0ABS7Q182_9ACTN|nr:YcxB family protein [Streptomyces acidipaludis]MBY8876210.1 YcxB family protein [Streptomyces acidipaludis]